MPAMHALLTLSSFTDPGPQKVLLNLATKAISDANIASLMESGGADQHVAWTTMYKDLRCVDEGFDRDIRSIDQYISFVTNQMICP